MTAVSAIIPVFNRASTVKRAIDSALSQAMIGTKLDVIVVDDGSTDALNDALAGYGDGVTVIRHDRNMGAAAARNSGVTAAKGDYVAFLDSDDIWLPGKIGAQLGSMQAHGWKASCTAYYLVRPQWGEVVSPQYKTGALGLSDLVWGCFVSPGSTLLFERTLFDQVGPLDTGMQRLEDWDWLLRYTRLHDLGFLAEPLARIELSPNLHAERVLAAIAKLEDKYLTLLTDKQRRNFQAALEVERAAVQFRIGNFGRALPALLRSLWLAPVRNAALSAVLYNRLARKPSR
ncbi:MAG: glycosyltransferase family 2 protein [Pseudolabrys sp.]